MESGTLVWVVRDIVLAHQPFALKPGVHIDHAGLLVFLPHLVLPFLISLVPNIPELVFYMLDVLKELVRI